MRRSWADRIKPNLRKTTGSGYHGIRVQFFELQELEPASHFRLVRREGHRNGAGAVSLVLITVGVSEVLVNANTELNELLADAVELRGGVGDRLNSLENLSGRVGASGGDATVLEDGHKINLLLETNGAREVVVLVMNIGRVGARTVLGIFVGPEALFVIAFQIRPHTLQLGHKISDLGTVVASSAVAGPRSVVALGPQSVDDPVGEV